MRPLKTLLLCFAALSVLALPGVAQESPARFSLRGGFYLGNGFTDGLLHTHLEGFEVGADVPIVRNVKGLNGIYFAPTVVFGGSNRTGPDTDGVIYRLMVNAKRNLGNSGVYAGIGLGLSFTQSRRFAGAGGATGNPASNSEFSDVAGVTGQILAGYVFGGASRRTAPFAEVSYFAGSNEKLSGVSLDAGIRF